MNKKILSCALVAAMLASSVGAMGVSAANDDAYAKYTPKSAMAVNDGTVNLTTVYTGTYEDALAEDMDKADFYYLFDYEVKDQDVVSYDDVVEAIDLAITKGDVTGSDDEGEVANSEGTKNTYWTAAIEKIKAYYNVSSDKLVVEQAATRNDMSDTRKEITDMFNKQLDIAEELKADADAGYYDTGAGSDWAYFSTGTLIQDMVDAKGLTASNSLLVYLASEGERVFAELSMTSNWEDKYTERYNEVSSWAASDYSDKNYRKIERLLEDAEDEASAGTEKGYKSAYDILAGAYEVETETPDYADLKTAVEALFDGVSPKPGVYAGDDDCTYKAADYKDSKGNLSDEWYEFAGYVDKENSENNITGAYQNAYEIYIQCKYSSTRKYVGQSRVDKALEELNDAILALDPNYTTANWVTVMLEDALDAANEVVEDDYRTTSSYWKTFVKDKEYIEKLLEQDNIKQSTAESAVANLLGDDMDASKVDTSSSKKAGSLADLSKCKLSIPTATKNDLKDAMDEAKDLLKDKTGKTATQIANLQKAYDDASELTTSKNTISEYENATTELNKAITAYKQAQGWYKGTDGLWYYGKEDTVAKGWLNVNGVWYLLDSETGAMKTGWQQVNGTWYYLDASGAMKTGWLNLNGTYYYLESWGGMATGWKNVNGSWYYLQPSGAMLANGWYWINGKCYYFYNWGGMAANTTIGGYTVDASGAWVK